jgi:hypothetical protein
MPRRWVGRCAEIGACAGKKSRDHALPRQIFFAAKFAGIQRHLRCATCAATNARAAAMCACAAARCEQQQGLQRNIE